jgi:SWI/SNF-related matrix-associated actin-dependent regulator of chromatin subfamily A3
LRVSSCTNDLASYQHVFTGAKRPEPQEARSGILADEMGLGKSLVILSTIAGSLTRAREFSEVRSENPAAKVPSRATLILAPSSRK